MPSALILVMPSRSAPPLAADLEAAGITVTGSADCLNLVQRAATTASDMVICYDAAPSDGLFASLSSLMAARPTPVVVFTSDPDAGNIARAIDAGVSAYVVNGYGPERLRPVIHVALARHAAERALRAELGDAGRRFTERTLVDRAKGILMGTRQLREEEAYRALRTAAMDSKQRIGQVSRQVIDAALYGEAVNRAGAFRMLSQRLVKLYALECADGDAAGTAEAVAASIALGRGNLAILSRSLSEATFGDLIAAVARPWQALTTALAQTPASDRLGAMDGLAADLLLRAEQLTNNLELARPLPGLQVINVAGRQRMLSQRVAKEALLGIPADATVAAFGQGLAWLEALPLSNAAIKADLDAAATAWTSLQGALGLAGSRDGRRLIAAFSETLLAIFDRVTDRYESGMQALIHRGPTDGG